MESIEVVLDPKAPIKRKPIVERRECKSRRKICFLTEREKIAKELIIKNSDDLVKNLSKAGCLDSFCSFVDLVAKDAFPLDNIAWLLFVDVVRFYSRDNASGMRYDFHNGATTLFWVYGQWLLHGKFLRFMTGDKFAGSLALNEKQRGEYDPANVRINFAVPSPSIIAKESKKLLPMPKLLQPGLMSSVLNTFLDSNKGCCFVLSFDGKLLRPGLTKNSGDVDMFGTENGPILSEQRHRLVVETELVDSTLESISIKGSNHLQSLEYKTGILDQIKKVVEALTARIQEIREKKLGKEAHLRSLMKQVILNFPVIADELMKVLVSLTIFHCI